MKGRIAFGIVSVALLGILIWVDIAGIGRNKQPKGSESETQVPHFAQEESNVAGEETEPSTKQATEEKKEKKKKFAKLKKEELSGLSNEIFNWGQGTNVDEKNRPVDSVNFQEKYGAYDADFVREDGDEKTIYLTFDEGYENGYTPQILDVLQEKDCKAVFFITMDYVKREPELVQRMIEEGHVVGSHSVTHPSAGMPSLSLEEQREEIIELHDYIWDNYQYNMYLFRYPAGIFSEQSLALMKQLGYRSVFWSFAHADWDPDNQPDEASSLEKVVKRLHPGAIYLLHAVSETNTNILGSFIDQARDAGYTFKEYK